MKVHFRRAWLASTILGASAVAVPQAWAQDAGGGLEEIVVTAQKREQSLQDVPIAVTAVTEESLQANRIFTVNDLLHRTREDLLSISNFGEKTLEEVYKSLENIGFYRPAKREMQLA